MDRLILMLQFFTRLPINKEVAVEQEDFKYGSIYLPVVGLIIGLINAGAYYIAMYSKNKYFAAVVTIMAWVMTTGALHMDGLSDTCDGMFSSRSRDRMLEIMKDSRIGTMGALAIVFSVLLKTSLVFGLDYKASLYSVIIAPVVARTSLLYAVTIAKYAREKGLGKTFIGNVTYRELVIGIIICILIVFPFLKLYSLIMAAQIIIVTRIMNNTMESKIGGMTGDTLGALCEMQEILSLFVLSLLSGYIWN